ncbi:MAG: LssY C-terminal domain-containing protein [Proteobacteria bacterium]|nr:LssY C-terminal domain-containing protein [Pseudomonadota bacterium]
MRKTVLLLALLLLAGGCASFSPPFDPPTDYLSRVERQESGNVGVTVTILSAEESDAVFATSLTKNGIQPVWIEIENGEDNKLLLMVLSIDPNYYAPSEAAWISRRWFERRSEDKMRYFGDKHIPLVIPPNSKVSGFVYTNLDPSLKAFAVELIGEHKSYTFEFVMTIPGFEADYERTRPDAVYTPDQVEDLDQDGLHTYLQALPCCVFGGDEKTPGDPLNLVIVGYGEHLLSVFARRGWDSTEVLTIGAAWRTAMSSIFKSIYRTSPVSSLYLFGRRQDAAMQKSRGSVDERNHLRLWRAPINFQGTPVWVGQISRDIGVRWSSKTIVTHKIDPNVDEARTYIMLDMMASRYLETIGFTTGVGASTRESPSRNYTKDPYFTDGLRVVLFVDEATNSYDEIHWLDWELPAMRSKTTKDQ